MQLRSFILVFVGAGTGGALRHLLNLTLNPLFAHLPLGTLVANVAGSGAAGALAGLLSTRVDPDLMLRPLLLVGFLGGLTTFSTFTLEVLQAIQSQRLITAGGIVLLHVCASLIAALAGLAGVRWLLG